MSIEITRHFVTIGNRQVMYRSAGHGPPVVLLHQSPKSSEEHLPLIRLLATDFTVLAPDTPGFGLSTSLDKDPESTPIDVFATATIEFLDALSLDKVGLYGIHTGASIATRLARLYPERLHCLIANGTLVLTDEERAEMLANYFVPFKVKWDGSHLTWLWSRLREQIIFFPWYRKDPVSRLSYAAPSAERLQHDALDFLNSGDAHRIAYRGAIAYDKAADMADVTPPTFYVCAETDVLMQYAVRFPELPPNSRFVAVPTAGDIFAKTLDIFRDLVPKSAVAPALPEAKAIAGQLASRYEKTETGEMRVRFADGASGPAILMLHELGASGASASPWIDVALGKHPIIIPDLPGHGDSDTMEADSLEALVEPVKALIGHVEGPVEIWAIGDAARLGAALVKAVGARVARLVLCDPFLPSDDKPESYLPDLSPSYEGAQLQRAWMAARDRGLFWPWPNTSPEGILRQAPIIDDEAVHRRTIDLLKSASAIKPLIAAIFAPGFMEEIHALPVPLKAVASPWLADHPLFQQRSREAELEITKLTGTPSDWFGQI